MTTNSLSSGREGFRPVLKGKLLSFTTSKPVPSSGQSASVVTNGIVNGFPSPMSPGVPGARSARDRGGPRSYARRRRDGACRQRSGEAGRALEDRNRQHLYEIAKKQDIPGRPKMGKWDLIKALRASR